MGARQFHSDQLQHQNCLTWFASPHATHLTSFRHVRFPVLEDKHLHMIEFLTVQLLSCVQWLSAQQLCKRNELKLNSHVVVAAMSIDGSA